MPATLYVKTGCPYCADLRARLEQKGVAFDEINVRERPEAIPELLKLTGGRRIVPVLVDDEGVQVAPGGG